MDVKILIIGGYGYVGSRVHEYLKFEMPTSEIEVVDQVGGGLRYQDLTQNYIGNFDSIIWLAGHSSVSQAIADPVGALRNNLVDLYEFGLKLKKSQIFIYASSASVYNRPEASLAVETDLLQTPLNAYDLSKKWFDEVSIKLTAQTYGLRFGTVSGMSPNIRTDLIVNAMVKSGLQNGYITVRNELSMRSILGISDLACAVKTILNECPEIGIYNVASESGTIGEIGERTANMLGVPVNIAPSDGTYNFQVATTKLENCTSWRSTETIESLVADLRVGLSR